MQIPVTRQKHPSEIIADRTWRSGFVHLTVDGHGLVSLWDDEVRIEASYLKLELTTEQMRLIEATMNKLRSD